MSLFDVIKYGNTNLANIVEVETLPEHLIMKVWHDFFAAAGASTYTHKQRCIHIWFTTSGKVDWTSVRSRFIKALEDYNEPI